MTEALSAPVPLLVLMPLERAHRDQLAAAGYDVTYAPDAASRAAAIAAGGPHLRAVAAIGTVGLDADEMAALPALEIACAMGVGHERVALDAARAWHRGRQGRRHQRRLRGRPCLRPAACRHARHRRLRPRLPRRRLAHRAAEPAASGWTKAGRARPRPHRRQDRTPRGSVVDTAALAIALRSGGMRAAGLDVYESEPQPPEELIGLDNVVLTPHVSGRSPQATQASVDRLVANLDGYFARRGPVSTV